MKGLIQKSGYIKPGNGGGHYAEYIATRDGVEVIEPTAGGGYLEYIAERPRSHGLFSASGAADLEQTMEEINAHAGPVWTFIYSLKREDAARLDYENGESWRRLLLAHQVELAAAMKIPPSSFRWCATFHDEKHHPHIHMMAWSANPKQGYLTEKGIEQMRSQLSNDIFQDELLSLYQEKELSYQEVRDAAMEAMGRLIREMKSGLCDSPVIAGQMETLAEMLAEVKGKKVYGYPAGDCLSHQPDGAADCGSLAAGKGPGPAVCNPGPRLQVNTPPGYGIIGTWKGGGNIGASNKVCPVCGRKMKQQFIGLQHCKCGMSWKKDIGFFERTSDMVFALERRAEGKKVKQIPVIRRKD